MTKMIFVRHGESTGNINNVFYGHTDGGLTELGRKQAESTAEYLKNYKIDAAYASDLIRAFETAEIIAKPHKLKVIPDKNLREIYAGKWENIAFSALPELYPNEYEIWKHDMWKVKLPEGESIKEMAFRVRDEVWKIAEENDGKTVLVVFHSTPIRSLICEWKKMPYEKISELGWVKNASVSIVDYNIEAHTTDPEIIGYADFQGGITSELPTSI